MIVCAECGQQKKAVFEPENAYSEGFYIFGCNCDDPDDCGYGDTRESAEVNYQEKHNILV